MKLVIAGSRSVGMAYWPQVRQALDEEHLMAQSITEVVSGTAKGADALGERWAEENGIPVKRMPANWHKYGKRAGPLRNAEMAKYVAGHGGHVIVFWDGVSTGTESMIECARRYGIEPTIIPIKIKVAESATDTRSN